MNVSLTYRNASESDIDLLWALRKATMKKHVDASYGWKDDEQFSYAKENLDTAKIIQVNGVDAGVIKVINLEDGFFLSQIQIDPTWSGQGIGNLLLTELTEKADHLKKEIRLHVIKVNPALKLYQKHGFKVTYEMEHQYEMTRKPEAV